MRLVDGSRHASHSDPLSSVDKQVKREIRDLSLETQDAKPWKFCERATISKTRYDVHARNKNLLDVTQRLHAREGVVEFIFPRKQQYFKHWVTYK